MRPYAVTVVCLGNICRSPMAQAVLQGAFEDAGLGDRVVVDSAGTAGWHEGRPADSRALAELQRAGYPSTHRAREFRRQWFEHVDLVLAMDRANLADLQALAQRGGYDPAVDRLYRSFDPDAGPDPEVTDPYYGGQEGFTEVLAMLQAACPGIVDHVSGQLGPGGD
jgi:protein-tyrosine phosphatase